MKNRFEVRGDIVAVFIDSPKFGTHETLISREQLERAKELPSSWYVLRNTPNLLYVAFSLPRENGKQKVMLLHRWLTNAPEGMVVDHIDHNTLNNTDSNLRVITNLENQQNRRGANYNSTSGVRGVGWHKKSKKWTAKIRINQTDKHIGSFDSVEEAEQAVIEARFKYMPFSNEIIG